MNTPLIAYFSYQGHTRRVAAKIQSVTDGTLFEIKLAEAYSTDYDTCEAQAKKETRDGYQPPLAENCQCLATSPVILLGTPNWFNTIAPPVATFLASGNSSGDFSGKTIIPFCTHGGGGLGHVVRDIQKLAPEATVLDCLDVYEGSVDDAERKIAAWLNKNGLTQEQTHWE